MKKPRPPKGALVHVHWLDAVSHDPWTNGDRPTPLKSMVCETVGWVVSTRGKALQIASSKGLLQEDATRDWASRWYIPWGMVQKIELLQVVQEAKLTSVEGKQSDGQPQPD
jgi:hypothetical protein